MYKQLLYFSFLILLKRKPRIREDKWLDQEQAVGGYMCVGVWGEALEFKPKSIWIKRLGSLPWSHV